jgi:CDP-diacylglycerol--glycerol-3-phosphate 3-phosphatidyltransferase
MEATNKPSKLNWPNVLSIARIVMAVIVPYLMLAYDTMEAHVAGLVIFIIASITDFVDGKLARRYNWITDFGKIIDSIADKLLVLGTMLTLALPAIAIIPLWAVLLIALREITITVLRMYFLTKGVVVQAVKSGKVKAAAQVGTIIYAYLLWLYETHAADIDTYPGSTTETVATAILWVLLLITLYLTLQSGFVFFRNNWDLLTGKSK